MKKLKVSILFLLSILFCFMISGCRNKVDEQVQTHIDFIVGMRANNKIPDFNIIRPMVSKATESFGSVGVIVLDGNPAQELSIDIPVESSMYSKNKLQSIAADRADKITEFILNTKAQDPEVDILRAFQIASDSLQSVTGDRIICISDSGIATKGLVNFSSTHLEDIDPEKVVDKLKEQSALPNLSGIRVKWYGMAQTALPQPEIEQKNKEVLKAVWRMILEESGAVVEIFDNPFTTKMDTREFPPVHVVDIIEGENTVFEQYTGKKEIRLDEGVLEFYGDQAIIKTDPDKVRESLFPVVNYLVQNPESRILLLGGTARPKGATMKYCIDLSERRCKTIRDILVEYGASFSQIVCKGMGYKSPFYQNDQNPDGSLNENIASKNRAVVILPIDHEIAKSVLVH